jgi:hypothetical protein
MFWVIETKTMYQGFRFNNPKHSSNSIIFVSFYSSHRDIKNVSSLIRISSSQSNPGFLAIRPRKGASKKLYKDLHFFVSMYTLPDSIKSSVVAKKSSTIQGQECLQQRKLVRIAFQK